ncbi:MAG: HAD family phosphatase [Bacilli bacterium]|nr:HAD family phosphatase [Bacilli bacterium]
MPKLLAVDLDGTLFYPRRLSRCISKRNVRFLRRWIDAGNRVVLITSRSLEFVQKLEKEIQRPFDYMPCTSSLIFADGKCIKHTWMNNKELSEIFHQVDAKYKPRGIMLTAEGHPCVVYDPGRLSWFLLFMYKLWQIFQFKYRERVEIDNKLFLNLLENGKVYKVMTFFGFGKKKGVLSKEINKELREKYPEIESSWSLIVNELTPKGCNKGEGVEEYCKALNIAKEDVYVIGDSGNDIAMFQKFHENSYCMAHSYPSVKKYAKHIVTRVYKLDKLVLKGEK